MSFFKSLSRTLIAVFGVALAILFAIQPASFAQSVNDWQSPAKQYGVWISDRAELISWQTELRLNRCINKLVGRTSAELAIATTPKLETGQSAREANGIERGTEAIAQSLEVRLPSTILPSFLGFKVSFAYLQRFALL